jgi:diguanylate cyclase (GGDEF)-like protein/PAS domain S-box-containing protein
MHEPARRRPLRVLQSLARWCRTDDAAPSVLVAGSLVAVYVVLRFAWQDDPRVRDALAAVHHLPVYLAAALLDVRAARHPALTPEASRAWKLLACAAGIAVVADAAWLFYGLVVHAAVSNWVGALYFAAYPFWAVGLLSFPVTARKGEERRTFWFDVTTVLVGGTMVAWYLVFRPAVLAAGQSDLLELVLCVAFPVGDLVLLLAAANLLARSPAESTRRALHLLVIGIVLQFVADLVYGHRRIGGLTGTQPSLDAAWFAAGVLFALAPRVQWIVASRSSVPVRSPAATPPRVTLLPYASVLAGVALLLVVSRPVWGAELGQVIIGSLLLTALVVGRQVIAARDNGRLVSERVRQDARFRSLVQNASDLITVVDASHRIAYQSPSVARLFGHPASEHEGLPLTDVVHPDDRATVETFLRRTINGSGALVTAHWRMWHRDGTWRAVESIGMNLLHDASVRGLVLNTRDVSERTALEAQLTHQAFHDPLTGLANRALLRDRMEHTLTRTRRQSDRRATLLFLDLDNFKTVNDSLGHEPGDSLLVEAARRLLACVRASDTVARLGGDEFAVFVEHPADDLGYTLAAERIVATLARPFTVCGRDLVIGASLGIATAQDDDDADDMLRNADMAMYMAKTRGKGRYEQFAPAMHVLAVDRIEMETDLRGAIEREELLLHYQPIVMLETGHITGAEALVRWPHAKRGLLAPGQFIPLAEETGLILPLGAWVLREACRQAQEWRVRRDDDAPLTITVNVSGRQIQSAMFIEDVRAALSASGLAPHALVLELTESVLTTQTETVHATLHALKDVGVRLAIDDFGTGYSSLSYLQRFPIDILKIAKPFIDDIAARTTPSDANGSRRALAQAVISLGATLCVRTIAEGIELPQQRERLCELGCELGQGFHFSRPVPARELEILLFSDEAAFSTLRRRGRRVSVQAEPL